MTHSQNSEKEIFNKLKEFEKNSKSLTEEDIFREIDKLDSSYVDNESYKFNIDGILVNIGTRMKSFKLLAFAKKRISKKLQNIKHAGLLYNLGNAELSIGDLKLNKSIEDLIVNKELRKSREIYNTISRGMFYSQANTNHANILEKFGRNYEAIYYYDKVLKYKPNFGMALGNKAIALMHYVNLASKKNPDIIFQVKDLLRKTIESEDTEEIGSQAAVKIFKKEYEKVSYIIEEAKLKIPSNIRPLDVESEYVKFCANKNIFLNYCFNCYKCEYGVKDNFSPTYLEQINLESNENNRISSFSKRIYYSIKTLNQIYEDYATARLIYFKAITENYSKQDKITSYASALDYCQNSIKYGFMKIVFIRLFNILDKIAHLLFTYYEIENDRKGIYFTDLKRQQFEDLVISEKSWNLLALHSLSWDFKSNQIYSYLNRTRNNLTHNFIDIKIDMYGLNSKDKLYKEHHLSEQLLCDYIDELFLLVKAALMYFVNALYNKLVKQEEQPGYIPKLYIVSQDYIFSNEDS